MRDVSTAFRELIEAVHPTDLIVVFATITHPSLSTVICVNSDVEDYVYNSQTYLGCAFEISFLTDDEQPPKASVAFPNVDRRIGEAIRSLRSSPKIKLEILLKSNFNDESPRRQVGTASVEYVAPELQLRNVTCDAFQVTADIFSVDISTEPYPASRATPQLLPGLFR